MIPFEDTFIFVGGSDRILQYDVANNEWAIRPELGYTNAFATVVYNNLC